MHTLVNAGAIATALLAVTALLRLSWRRVVHPGLRRGRRLAGRMAYVMVPDLASVSRSLAEVTRELHELAGSFLAYAVADKDGRAADRAQLHQLDQRVTQLGADVDHAHTQLREHEQQIAQHLETHGAPA